MHQQLLQVWTLPWGQQLQCHICSWEQPRPVWWPGSFVFSYFMWLQEAVTARAAILVSPLVRPLWDKRTAFPQGSDTNPGQGWAPPCPSSTHRVWANSCSISQLMVLGSDGVQDEKILSSSSCLFPLFTCISPLSLSVLWMSLSTKSVSLRHHSYSPGTKGEGYLSRACM